MNETRIKLTVEHPESSPLGSLELKKIEWMCLLEYQFASSITLLIRLTIYGVEGQRCTKIWLVISMRTVLTMLCKSWLMSYVFLRTIGRGLIPLVSVVQLAERTMTLLTYTVYRT